MNDCISREVVKDMLTAEWTKYMPMELDINLSFVLDKISALPSVTPSYNSVKTELKPSEDCIRELIREFDDKHPALFADHMQEFNNHPILEIIECMWDMHDLIQDIKYRLSSECGAESEDVK